MDFVEGVHHEGQRVLGLVVNDRRDKLHHHRHQLVFLQVSVPRRGRCWKPGSNRSKPRKKKKKKKKKKRCWQTQPRTQGVVTRGEQHHEVDTETKEALFVSPERLGQGSSTTRLGYRSPKVKDSRASNTWDLPDCALSRLFIGRRPAHRHV